MKQSTRLLKMYNKLLNGERINKAYTCLETGITFRTFDRDIEELRIFLSESFSVRELLYDKNDNSYYLSGHRDSFISAEEASIIQQIVMDSKVMNPNEYKLISNRLYSVTEVTNNNFKPLGDYITKQKRPLIKLFNDILYSINKQLTIRLLFYKHERSQISIIPKRIYIENGCFWISAKNTCNENIQICLSDIESFTIENKHEVIANTKEE